MKIPEHIAARIADTIRNLGPQQPYHIDWEAQQQGALALMGTIGSTWLLRPDGSFFDIDSDFGKPLTPLPENLQLVAIAYGCERYPWLRELIPSRPAAALDCPKCAGSGQLVPASSPHGPILCHDCQALGWIPSDQAR